MLRISSKMLHKHKVALSQQLVLKRVLLTSVLEEHKHRWETRDREELCCRNSITTTTTNLKINFKHGQPDVGFEIGRASCRERVFRAV